jgi:3-oxoacyl-[acyl-carrier-protein] synthase III
VTAPAPVPRRPAVARPGLRVRGWGAALPPRVVGSDEVERLVRAGSACAPAAGRLATVTGVRARRWAAGDVQPSDLAAEAGRRALAGASCPAGEVGVLIFASVSADVFEPAVANIVQEKLGATGAAVLDIRAGANSVLYALHSAMAMTDESRPVLVTSGEVLSRRMRTRFASPEAVDLGLLGLAGGDAGAALLLQRHDAAATGTLPFGRFVTRGRHWRAAFVESGGARRGSDLADDDLKADVAELDRCTLDILPGLLREVVHGCGWDGDDVLVATNLSDERATRVAGLARVAGARVVSTVADCGHAGAASIPLALCLAADEGRVPRGQRIVLVGAAAGFSGAAVPLVW